MLRRLLLAFRVRYMCRSANSIDRVASLDTEFMVEEEPLRMAMRSVFERGRSWPLGILPEGHEWLCMVAAVVGDEAIDPQLIGVDGTIDPRLTVVDTTTS